jgi:hypothetical protein
LDPRKRRKKAQEKEKEKEAAAPSQECIVIEWSSGTVDDLMADSVAAIACQCCVSPWAILQTHDSQHACAHSHNSR